MGTEEITFMWKTASSWTGDCPALYKTNGGYYVQVKRVSDPEIRARLEALGRAGRLCVDRRAVLARGRLLRLAQRAQLPEPLDRHPYRRGRHHAHDLHAGARCIVQQVDQRLVDQ